MTTVIVHLLDIAKMSEMYKGGFDKAGKAALVERLLEGGHYRMAPAFTIPESGEDAADEAFDLTNNPIRQAERERKYGGGRSVSVGDIVETDVGKFVCCSMGWAKL